MVLGPFRDSSTLLKTSSHYCYENENENLLVTTYETGSHTIYQSCNAKMYGTRVLLGQRTHLDAYVLPIFSYESFS